MEELLSWHGPSGPAVVALLTVAFACGLALVALWIALPFAVLGLRSALRDLVAAQRETNRELGEIRRNMERLGPPAEKPRDPAP